MTLEEVRTQIALGTFDSMKLTADHIDAINDRDTLYLLYYKCTPALIRMQRFETANKLREKYEEIAMAE